jgi:hypothetical protein
MRKSIATLACLIVTAQFCFSVEPLQERSIKKSDVPSAILSAFERSYPNATVKGFSEEKDGERLIYEIESVEGTTSRDVTYTSDGAVVSVEETVPLSEFPESVRTSLNKEFPRAKISKSEKVMKGSSVQYEVLLRSGKRLVEVVFNSDGTVAKTEEKKRGEKD